MGRGVSKNRWVILAMAMLLFMAASDTGFGENVYDWNFKPAKNNQPPTTEPHYIELLDRYDGYFIGDTDTKNIYLTFDSGYENGCTDVILDVLKEKGVPAAFFVTGYYFEREVDLIKRMDDEGHIVGNHSWNHPSFPDLNDEEVISELAKVEKAFKTLTGKKMNYLRPPRGTFNERTMKIAKEEGYQHIFWSFAYVDWDPDAQKGKTYAYDRIMDRVHPGAVLLLHSVSKDNAAALGDVIDELKAEGYQFQSLDHLTGRRFPLLDQ
ncbi:delta-lactam-biosynthetic de-N-acetylase [Salicibibacter cibi]|uniref:Delta-lactam-biosynthetic de-N-acetylase n=1 Tax=Salicibibacter cibi TaxID=2743001 RepID=A0A7T6Z9S2_9BACI|nr:delta-lactam-biosynthetic de-N-acetylase [Salicibibacter cibi]QQK79446.1 delta-lactam-biosynthetic de-N-acetylase [Salicibibacter cibi]